MGIRRSTRSIDSDRMRRLKHEAERIDDEERPAITARGREVLAWQRQIEEVVSALRAERRRRGLSLGDVAARSGIDKANLSRLENAAPPNPTIETLRRYAEAIGCRIGVAVLDADDERGRRAAG